VIQRRVKAPAVFTRHAGGMAKPNFVRPNPVSKNVAATRAGFGGRERHYYFL
jgi:hypothetical protein